MTRCVTVDQSVLEKTKMDKVLPRLVKRGDDQGKTFAQQILDNAALASQQKTNEGKVAQNHQSNGITGKSLGGSSRPVDLENQKARAADMKKSSNVSNPKMSGTTTSKSASSEVRQANAKVNTKGVSKTAANDTSTAKVKTNHITAKPTGYFSSLQSASKKPGTSSKLKDSKHG